MFVVIGPKVQNLIMTSSFYRAVGMHDDTIGCNHRFILECMHLSVSVVDNILKSIGLLSCDIEHFTIYESNAII